MIGEVSIFGGNFAPSGWEFCDGQLLAISQYQSLFSILGTTYGGDGRMTFGLPDLRGRTAIGEGSGPGLTPRPLGQKIGVEAVTLTEGQLPAHNHSLPQSINTTENAGGNQSHNNMQPSIALNYNIAMQGIYPPRDSGTNGSTGRAVVAYPGLHFSFLASWYNIRRRWPNDFRPARYAGTRRYP